MSKIIALVDDDRNILTSVSMALENEGFKVQTYLDGESAYIGITRNPPDLAVIDIKMPRMNGEELLKKLRKKTDIPIIFLTSKDEELDELLGLKLGADDFVKKSGGFSIKVLIERIKVQFRKRDQNAPISKNTIQQGKLILDPEQLECQWDSQALPDKLTTTEFQIVYELAKRPGVIKERSHLMTIAYRENNDIEDRTIDSHVKRIRKKFKKIDKDFSAIETRYGSGYRWNVG
jgi:two-component system response regulator ChvI